MKLSERFLDEAEGYGPGPVTLHDVDIKHLQCLLREASALARRVEEAPAGELFVSHHDARDFALADDGNSINLRYLAGKIVRIVEE